MCFTRNIQNMNHRENVCILSIYSKKDFIFPNFFRSVLFSMYLLMTFMFHTAYSISCFQCDSLEKQHNDCPGWGRPPVHSVTDLSDRNGFYTHCLDVRLEDNTVLHQTVVPHRPTCRSDFIRIWKASLEKQFKTNITITCCNSNACNGPNMITSGSQKIDNDYISLVVILLSFWNWTLYHTKD